MSPFATILVPTFDHGPTVRYAVESALAQTVDDLEIVVLGDGVPPDARTHVDALEQLDARVTVLHHPKSPRQGEPWRAQALERARGEIVLYLSDDDLWLPDHVATQATLLADSDFAHTLPTLVGTDGHLVPLVCDLAREGFAERMNGGHNWIPLSAAAHTLAAYRRLPVGWETTPEGIWTDLYMWQKFLRLPGVRLASGTTPTVLCFPSPARRDRSSVERATELDGWAKRIADPDERSVLVEQIRAEVVRNHARLEEWLLAHVDGAIATSAELERVTTERDAALADRGAVAAERDVAAAERDAAVAEREAAVADRDAAVPERELAVAERDAAQAMLDEIGGTLTWRLRQRLLASRLGRTAATARAARAARRLMERRRHAR